MWDVHQHVGITVTVAILGALQIRCAYHANKERLLEIYTGGATYFALAALYFTPINHTSRHAWLHASSVTLPLLLLPAPHSPSVIIPVPVIRAAPPSGGGRGARP
jgi:hypothetical protein